MVTTVPLQLAAFWLLLLGACLEAGRGLSSLFSTGGLVGRMLTSLSLLLTNVPVPMHSAGREGGRAGGLLHGRARRAFLDGGAGLEGLAGILPGRDSLNACAGTSRAERCLCYVSAGLSAPLYGGLLSLFSFFSVPCLAGGGRRFSCPVPESGTETPCANGRTRSRARGGVAAEA